MKMSRGENALQVTNEIHPPIKGTRLLVPAPFLEPNSSPWQECTHGLNSHIPVLETLREPELAEINLNGNKFFMDSYRTQSLCIEPP